MVVTKGTFEEAINFYAAHDLEFDANIGGTYVGYTFSFCDIPYFSDYCREKYGDLLKSECEVIHDRAGKFTDSVIVDYADHKKGERFAAAWAGYVAESEYDKLFEKPKDGE